MTETPRTEAVAALARLVHFACVEVDGEWALAHQPEAHERALTVALRNLPTNDRRSIAAALRSEAQDTAASSELREALEQAEADAPEESRRFISPFAGGFREGARWALNRWRTALAHSTPEPSLRDALAAAIGHLTDDDFDDLFGLWVQKRRGPLRDLLVNRLAALSAQPSEPGETE